MSNEPKQAENGDRLLCDPWRGARTPEFRKFKRDFKASADALFLHEDDYSVWQAMADADQGGRAQNADALPGPNQGCFKRCRVSLPSMPISWMVAAFASGIATTGGSLTRRS